jgi:hypothetical protein
MTTAAIPTQDQVLAAVVTALGGIGGIGTVVNGFHTYEDDVEYIQNGGFISSGSMDLWFVELRRGEEIEAVAGEFFERYHVEIRYWSLRTNDPAWSKKARLQAESVRDALTANSGIFAIGGQRQLQTPELVRLESHGPYSVSGIDDKQMVYQTILSLEVEARRWL